MARATPAGASPDPLRIDHQEVVIADTSSPQGDEQAKRISYKLRGLVHELYHAKIGPPGLTQPSTVHSVLGNLDWVRLGLASVLENLRRYLLNELQAGRLTHLDSADINDTIRTATEAIAHSKGDLARLGDSLGTAETELRPVHGKPTGPRTRDFPAPITEALQADQQTTSDNPPPTTSPPPRRPTNLR